MASGKTTVSRMFEACGAEVVDADALVHTLQGPETKVTKAIASLFGDDILDDKGAVCRPKLSAKIRENPSKLKELENIIHPAVRNLEEEAIRKASAQGKKLVVLDIPLLFETNAHQLCDASAWCDCDIDLRRLRALERHHMTTEQFDTLQKRRIPDDAARRQATYLIPTDGSIECTQDEVEELALRLKEKTGSAFEKHWQG